MIRIRRGVASGVRERRPGLVDLMVDVDGAPCPAIAYPALSGPVADGDLVVVNTSAVALGLGTGGFHVVVAVEGGPERDGGGPRARSMKLRYTPSQIPVSTVEEDGGVLPESLDGMPVVAAGLHSAVAPVVIAARAAVPELRVALVVTGAAALPLAFSDTVAALRDAGLLHVTVTCDQAFGGDVEAVTKHSAMLAAKAAGAEIVCVAMGPGHLGTGTRYGFSGIEAGEVVNAAAALGGRPILVPRVGFGDARERHAVVSHHTLTILERIALAPAAVALPLPASGEGRLIRAALRPACARHTIVDVGLGAAEDALRDAPVRLSTMGRGFAEEPEYFRVAAAAGVYAAGLAREAG